MTFHALDYVEITVSEVARAKAFYAAALGWEFTDYGPDYAGIHPPGSDTEAGGLIAGTPAPGGGVLPLARSADLTASLAAFTAAGGTVNEAPYDYPGGRRFTGHDPDGNVVGVYEPAG